MKRESRYQVKLFSDKGVKVVGSWRDKAQAWSMFCKYRDDYKDMESVRVALFDQAEQHYYEYI